MAELLGLDFARYAWALLACKGSIQNAAGFAEKQWGRDASPTRILRSAVSAGSTLDATWAEPLTQYQNSAGEFLQLARSRSLLGKLSGYREVALRMKIPRITSGSVVGWVGQRSPISVSEMALQTLSLQDFKIAGQIIVSNELRQMSAPAVERVLRADMASSVASMIDQSMISPTFAGETNVSPPSITSVADFTAAASGTTIASIDEDLKWMINSIVNSGVDFVAPYWICSPRTAAALATKRGTANEASAYPDVAIQGGSLLGIPLVVTSAVPTTGSVTDSPNDLASSLVLLDASHLVVSEMGGIMIEVSENASVQADTAASSPVTADVVTVSLWQNDLSSFRVVMPVSWELARTDACAVLTSVNW